MVLNANEDLIDNPYISTEDLVSKTTDDGKVILGLVCRVGWQSEDEDEDDSDAEEDIEKIEDEKDEPLELDQIEVEWHGGDSEILRFDQVQMVDRSLSVADAVVKASDPHGQKGVVIEARLFGDIYFPSTPEKSLFQVPLNAVRPLHPQTGQVVAYGEWLGQVIEPLEMLKLRFSTGKECWINTFEVDPKEISIEDTTFILDAESDFLPGQTVQCSLDALEAARWIGLQKFQAKLFNTPSKRRATIVEVKSDKVFVNWVARRGIVSEMSLKLSTMEDLEEDDGPNEQIERSKLKYLDYFESLQFLSGSRVRVPLSLYQKFDAYFTEKRTIKLDLWDKITEQKQEQKAVLKAAEVAAAQTKPTFTFGGAGAGAGGSSGKSGNRGRGGGTRGGRGAKSSSASSSFSPILSFKVKEEESIVGIVTRTYFYGDIKWQDGTISNNMSSLDLLPNRISLETDFYPDEFVEPVIPDAVLAQKLGDEQYIGCVLTSDSVSQTTKVCWFSTKSTSVAAISPSEVAEVSSYTIANIEQRNFEINDTVFDQSEKVEEEAEAAEAAAAAAARKEKEEDTKQNDQQEASAQQQSQMITSEGEKKKKAKKAKKESAEPKKKEENPAWVGTIIGFEDCKIRVYWIDGSISLKSFNQLMQYSSPSEDDDDLEEYLSMHGLLLDEDDQEDEDGDGNGEEGEMEIAPRVRRSNKIVEVDDDGNVLDPEQENNENDDTDADNAKDDENDESDRLFDHTALVDPDQKQPTDMFLVEDEPKEHNFSVVPAKPAPKQFASAIMKEWNVLRSNMGPGIFLKVYERRLDLLSLLVIGAEKTPFQDVPFVFDIYLPEEYPNCPPTIHFQTSFKVLHPNLNSNGTVCLSLLDTWHGKGSESWTPGTSNLLQVILSIQGLILGESLPYFLEAGYDKQRGTLVGLYQACRYNEMSFLHSLDLLRRLIEHPAPDFSDIITKHLKLKTPEIIGRVKSYLEWHALHASSDHASSSNKTPVEIVKNADDNPLGIPLASTKGFAAALAVTLARVEEARLAASVVALEI